MVYRRYNITIAPRHHFPLPHNLLREFGCSITEPSNWLQGMTLERGLTFLDRRGHELSSEVFTHIPLFSKTPKTTEKKEIEEMIRTRIKNAFGIEATHIHIHVSEY